MKNWICLSLCLFSSVPLALGQTVTVHSFSQIERYIQPSTLVIVDIDNTLITPSGNYGGDAWFHYVWDAFREAGHGENAYQLTLNRWIESQGQVRMKPVERDTPLRIRKWMSTDHPVLALTARNPILQAVTQRQMSQAKINLAPKHEVFKKGIPPSELDGSVYSDGILYVAGASKGPLLKLFLNKVKFTPTSIVYVDDKRANVISIDDAFKDLDNVAVTSIHYRFLDKKVHRFKKKMDWLIAKEKSIAKAVEKIQVWH